MLAIAIALKKLMTLRKMDILMKTCNKCRTKKIKSEEINEIKEDLSNYKKHDIWKEDL